MVVMECCLPSRHELLANPHRKWHVGQTVAVKVSQLAPPDVELDEVTAVRHHGHTRPAGHFTLDDLGDVSHEIEYRASGLKSGNAAEGTRRGPVKLIEGSQGLEQQGGSVPVRLKPDTT